MLSYVFILSPPYCGSTLLYRLLETSSAVSCLPEEGQFIDGASDILREDAWNPEKKVPWDVIKSIWHEHWDDQKQYLVEKSPPNIVRAAAIQTVFQPAQFILLVRNPYAHVEGLLRRRDGWDEERAAKFSIFCLEQQIKNLRTLKNTLSVSYENLCNQPLQVSEKITAFLPNLGSLNVHKEFNLHSVNGQRTQKITNLNSKKLKRLSSSSISKINSYFEKHMDVIEFWGYEHFEPGKFHNVMRYL